MTRREFFGVLGLTGLVAAFGAAFGTLAKRICRQPVPLRPPFRDNSRMYVFPTDEDARTFEQLSTKEPPDTFSLEQLDEMVAMAQKVKPGSVPVVSEGKAYYVYNHGCGPTGHRFQHIGWSKLADTECGATGP